LEYFGRGRSLLEEAGVGWDLGGGFWDLVKWGTEELVSFQAVSRCDEGIREHERGSFCFVCFREGFLRRRVFSFGFSGDVLDVLGFRIGCFCDPFFLF